MRLKHVFTAVIIASASALGACGLQGDLKTPPPIWGEDERSAEEIAKNAPTPKPGQAPVTQKPAE